MLWTDKETTGNRATCLLDLCPAWLGWPSGFPDAGVRTGRLIPHGQMRMLRDPPQSRSPVLSRLPPTEAGDERLNVSETSPTRRTAALRTAPTHLHRKARAWPLCQVRVGIRIEPDRRILGPPRVVSSRPFGLGIPRSRGGSAQRRPHVCPLARVVDTVPAGEASPVPPARCWSFPAVRTPRSTTLDGSPTRATRPNDPLATSIATLAIPGRASDHRLRPPRRRRCSASRLCSRGM